MSLDSKGGKEGGREGGRQGGRKDERGREGGGLKGDPGGGGRPDIYIYSLYKEGAGGGV